MNTTGAKVFAGINHLKFDGAKKNQFEDCVQALKKEAVKKGAYCGSITLMGSFA